MKILVFEYIVGGGLAQDELPDSLMREGTLMLKALVNEIVVLPGIQLTVLLDWRCKELILLDNVDYILVSAEQTVFDVLAELMDGFDMIWPIAPETGSVLQELTVLLESKARRLLNSSSKAVAMCTDKFLLSLILNKAGIKTVQTVLLNKFSDQFVSPWVIKPKDGMACLNCYQLNEQSQLDKIAKQIECKSDYIIQPYIKGKTLSLSCLFKDGQGWLLCCNQQQISIVLNKFELNACIVNLANENGQSYQKLIDRLASEIPGLWGYVGIDIIQPEFGFPMVVDINPRLTTSYAGINPALGINVAKLVIEMADIEPDIIASQNNQITVLI